MVSDVPELIKDWDFSRNKLDPYKVRKGSNMRVWWKCRENDAPDHEWTTSPNGRSHKGYIKKCPFCANIMLSITNSLASIYPELLEEWDYSKNTLDPTKLIGGSNKKVWWKCKIAIDHEWFVSPNNRVRKKKNGKYQGCPYCGNDKVSEDNCLSIKFPEEWHPTKNGDLKINQVVFGSHKKVWWKCLRKGHEWTSPVFKRTGRGDKCPKCVPIGGSLAETHPLVAKEWDFVKNKLKPDEVYTSSRTVCWWICSACNNSWSTPVTQRTKEKGSDCPRCCNGSHSKPERYLRFELLTFLDVAPEDSKLEINGNTYTPDIILPKIKLIIEYDGWYFHKDQLSLDSEKSKIFINDGWNVIRVRECSKQGSLSKITTNDIIKNYEKTLKEVSNELFIKINNICNTQLVLDDYLKKSNLTNKIAADIYIMEKKGLTQKEINDKLIKQAALNEEKLIAASRKIVIRERIIQLINENASITQKDIAAKINEEFGFSFKKSAIDWICHDGGIRREPLFSFKKKIVEYILKLSSEDLSLTLVDISGKIHEEFNYTLSPARVGEIRRENGIFGISSHLERRALKNMRKV